MGGTIFVGRSGELDALRAAFEASAEGRLTSVLVCGESGIGKSCLVRQFTRTLLSEHPDAMVLEGGCHKRDAIPYKTLDGVVDALSRWLSSMPESEVASLLPARHALLTRLFPVLLRVPQLGRDHANAESESGPPSDLRQRAFIALRDLFTRVALRHPTVVAIDDLQWADPDGLQALAEILRPPDAPPLLFVGIVTIRQSDDGLAQQRLRSAISGDVRAIDLTGLGEEDARALATVLLRHGGAIGSNLERIVAEARGHPLFVEELVRLAAIAGPTAVDLRLNDAVWAPVAQLDAATLGVAELVAVAGRPLPEEIAAAAAHLDLDEFRRRAAILRAANVVQATGSQRANAIAPYHDRVTEAVLARLEPSRRRSLHESLAVAFEASSQLDAETLAMHWREAGNAEVAAGYAVAAGDQALRTFAFDRATSWFEQALELLPEGHDDRQEARVKLGEALAFSGRGALK